MHIGIYKTKPNVPKENEIKRSQKYKPLYIFIFFISYLSHEDALYSNSNKERRKYFLRKISSQSKNYGRHESQTQESPMLIRIDYEWYFCFLEQRSGIPFSALHFSQEIPRPGLDILLDSRLSSWQKEFRDRVERCQERFTNPHWCLIHVVCMAVICHSLSCRGDEKKIKSITGNGGHVSPRPHSVTGR